MVSIPRVIFLAVSLCLAAPGATHAQCQGHDLFPALKIEAPAAYAAIENAATEMPFRRGKLFRLSRQGADPSYVFATLHLSDPRITGFSSQLRAALTQSKIVVLESTETGDVLRQVMADNRPAWRRATAASEDLRADRLLDKKDFAQLEALVASKGFPESAAREYNPAMLALLLDLPGCAASTSTARPYVDEIVANIARDNKIETVGLERMIEQVEILNGLPRDTERGVLVALLRQSERGEDGLETTIARYIEGDIGGYLAWLRSADPIPGVADAQMPKAFLDRLIPLRNHRMRDRALPILQRGGVFLAVGAAHLPGRDGLLSLFEQAGYTIETFE
jgi:uncharacterized protein